MFFIDEGSWFPAKQIQTAALGLTSVIIEVHEKNIVHLKNIDLFDFVFVRIGNVGRLIGVMPLFKSPAQRAQSICRQV